MNWRQPTTRGELGDAGDVRCGGSVTVRRVPLRPTFSIPLDDAGSGAWRSHSRRRPYLRSPSWNADGGPATCLAFFDGRLPHRPRLPDEIERRIEYRGVAAKLIKELRARNRHLVAHSLFGDDRLRQVAL